MSACFIGSLFQCGLLVSTVLYGVNLKNTAIRNYDFSEMCEYFCTKFCSFVWKTAVQKCAALCCIYLTYARLTETQTSRANFATVRMGKI